MSNDRFSIMILEQDVLEYHNNKLKYNEYYELHKNAHFIEKEELKNKRDYWYNKYINKMRYLEQTYRKTSIYTDYHKNLENKPRHRRHTMHFNPIRTRLNPLPSAPTLPPRSTTPIVVPTAIPLSPNRRHRSCSPIVIPPENCRPTSSSFTYTSS